MNKNVNNNYDAVFPSGIQCSQDLRFRLVDVLGEFLSTAWQQAVNVIILIVTLLLSPRINI